MRPEMVTTALELPGYRIRRNVGVARGIVVRSRSIVGNVAGVFQTLLGGNITVYTNLCERTRTDAYRLMCEQAEANGANAIIMMRYDANEILNGVTEVICYGSAVVVEEERGVSRLGAITFALFVAGALIALAELWLSPWAWETFVKLIATDAILVLIIGAWAFFARERRETEALRDDKRLR